MSDISDIKIIGIDKDRPPRIRKEAYIDLFFRLSQKCSVDWCEDFNALGRKIDPSPKIDKNKGECIETYVKNMTLIAQHLADVKALLRDCNEKHQAKIDEKARVLAASNASLQGGQEGEQYKLNQIIESLNFDD
ncbi:MAG: hypothetical protein LJE92_00075 [Gammaproteobacteria bacterium]|jgi:hypothetical protein|nr:hypothetical protein [Gammaproteobacteria bacterium]HUV20383.1 hypothetical protein [Gammaproteobacteria bacterium]